MVGRRSQDGEIVEHIRFLQKLLQLSILGALCQENHCCICHWTDGGFYMRKRPEWSIYINDDIVNAIDGDSDNLTAGSWTNMKQCRMSRIIRALVRETLPCNSAQLSVMA